MIKRLVNNVDADSACSACYASLVRALYVANREGVRIKDKIHIGQGYQGKSLDGIGIGRCCGNARVCVIGCPPTADAIITQLRKQVI